MITPSADRLVAVVRGVPAVVAVDVRPGRHELIQIFRERLSKGPASDGRDCVTATVTTGLCCADVILAVVFLAVPCRGECVLRSTSKLNESYFSA